jgi:D-aminopeptidase
MEISGAKVVILAMIAAETLKGINGNAVHAIPHDRLREILQKYNRLRK